MSYILEALRKAERERNLGQTPNLSDVTHAPPAPSERPRSRMWVIFAFVIAGLFLALLWSWRRGPESSAVPAAAVTPMPKMVPAVPAAPPPAAAPAVAAAPAPVPSLPRPELESAPGTLPGSPPAIGGDQNVATLDDLYPPENEEGQGATPSTKPTAPTRAANEPAVKMKNSTAAEIIAEMSTENAQASAAAPPTASEAPPPDSAPVPDGLKKLKDMSPGYRADFPQFSIDVHVSNVDPSKRFTLISGHRYKEGDALPEGPRIVEIIEAGIVFDFRGERVLVSLPR